MCCNFLDYCSVVGTKFLDFDFNAEILDKNEKHNHI